MRPSSALQAAVRVSLISNVALFVIKLITLVIVNSLAVAADLGISVIALAVSGILYYALRTSDRPADVQHNYGYGKVENVTEAVEGIVMVGLALAMSVQALLHLIHPGQVHLPLVGLIAGIFGVLINFRGAKSLLRLAALSASPAVRAEGIHFRLEGYISLSITLAFLLIMIFEAMGLHELARFVDPIATLVVSAVVAVPSARLLREAYTKLLDASIGEPSQMGIMRALATHAERYCNIGRIRTRSAGRMSFVDLQLVLPRDMSIERGHRVVSALKADVEAELPGSEVTVHVAPCTGRCVYLQSGRTCPIMEAVAP
jgi:cation diffusion facilitator family transporter